MDLVQVLPNALYWLCVSIKHALKKQGIKTLKPLISQGFQVSVSILVTQYGRSVIIGSQKTQIYQWFAGRQQEVFILKSNFTRYSIILFYIR